jgi:hypothetical protein
MPLLSELRRQGVGRAQTGTAPREPLSEQTPPASPRSCAGTTGATALHISKLRGITNGVRARLKRQGISYTDQLLAAAGPRGRLWRLALHNGIDSALLARLVCRADLVRVKGIGAIFADMLELLGVDRVSRLARQDPAKLHRALLELNAAERFARRAPTPDEVRHWIVQARSLPHLVDDDG